MLFDGGRSLKVAEVFWLCLCFRGAIAVLLSTGFAPDEYFQTLEPAFRAVFGYGIRTWEWTEQYQLRSFVSVMPYMIVITIIEKLGVEATGGVAVALAARAVQACISAVGDASLWYVASVLGGERAAGVCMLLQLGSWSGSYALSRTLSNGTEAALCSLCAALLLRRSGRSSQTDSISSNGSGGDMTLCSVVAVSVACVFVRPTSLVLLVPMWLAELQRERIQVIVTLVLPLGLVLAALCVAVDTHCYAAPAGSLVVTPYNFFRINYIENYAERYGVNAWHWYYSQGLPVMLGGHLPLVLMAIGRIRDGSVPALVRVGVCLGLLYPAVLSLSPHKEFRFLLPVLPFLHLAAACEAVRRGKGSLCLRLYLRAAVGCHVVAAVYLCTRHQAGPEMAYRDLVRLRPHTGSTQATVLLLAPCHAFPGYAFLPPVRVGGNFNELTQSRHPSDDSVGDRYASPYRLLFPDCSPDVGWSETMRFGQDPAGYLSSHMCAGEECPESFPTIDYVLTFDGYCDEALRSLLDTHGFAQLRTFHHADFRYDMDDPVSKRRVLLFERRSTSGALTVGSGRYTDDDAHSSAAK